MTCSHDVRCHDNKKLITIGSRPVFASSFSTGPPGDRGALHCRWNVIATQPLGLVSCQARCILPVTEEQSRTCCSQSCDVEDQPQFEDQPQCRGLWHSSSPSARSLSRSPSPPPLSFTQSPSPPSSLVRDGQTGPQCVFITAGPSTKLFAVGGGVYIGGHVLRETTSRGLCGLVCHHELVNAGEREIV